MRVERKVMVEDSWGKLVVAAADAVVEGMLMLLLVVVLELVQKEGSPLKR